MTSLAPSSPPLDDGQRLAESGAELVALSERFYVRAFGATLLFVALSVVAALALIPLRDSASDVGLTTPTVILAAIAGLAAPLAAARAGEVYRRLRGNPSLEFIPVAISAALLAYPLRSELWWPACALLMVVAAVAPFTRTLAYCVLVLVINLLSHLASGDLPDTPAVTILGNWIGFGFWTSTIAVFVDRIAAYLLRLDASRADPQLEPEPEPPREDEPQVDDATVVEQRFLPAPREAAPVPLELERLTARQLQVTALLADGLRYQEIAACLSISYRQVQRHAADTVRRLGVRNANELVAVAVCAGLTSTHVAPVDGGARGRSGSRER